mmetsp:Transcript_1077/g.1569  ORF Transcript_1077/g.1569 Transcript_1077/m.1569 type:complete len:1041 (+) Transcript_1077:254-3376(+)
MEQKMLTSSQTASTQEQKRQHHRHQQHALYRIIIVLLFIVSPAYGFLTISSSPPTLSLVSSTLTSMERAKLVSTSPFLASRKNSVYHSRIATSLKMSISDKQQQYQQRRTTNRNRRSEGSIRQRHHNQQQKNNYKGRRRGRLTPQEEEERFRRAQDVEHRMIQALVGMKNAISSYSSSTSAADTTTKPLLFPSVRECNAALATLGDRGDLLRALQLFVKMRKAASLASYSSSSGIATATTTSSSKENVTTMIKPFFHPPTPTLVTYSTLMSRAVKVGKPRVALRLWKLMMSQREFYTNYGRNKNIHSKKQYLSPIAQAPIIPDVRSVNILMNAYAKLGDYEAAYSLLQQMLSTKRRQVKDHHEEDGEEGEGEGDGVPKLSPNLVTYNTLLDACHRANNLPKALDVLEEMKSRGIHPDARTYTTIISTVGRQRVIDSQNSNTYLSEEDKDNNSAYSRHRGGGGGRRGRRGDPDIAFALLYEMEHDYDIKPNGMTYCALIDACGRCYRNDLALKGLRMMLREKKKLLDMEQQRQQQHQLLQIQNKRQKSSFSSLNTLFIHEVGAWTAAIDACCKSNRYDTAIKLFWTMQSPNFQNIKPNTVTCGCLIDRLLKAQRISDTLDVLRYMKNEGLEPSEVMYTSLMSCAEKLARLERNNYAEDEEEEGTVNYEGDGMGDLDDRDKDVDFGIGDIDNSSNNSGTKAIELYTELMRSLMGSSSSFSSSSLDQNDKIAKIRTSQQNERVSNFSRDIANINDAKTLLVKVFLVFQEMRDAGAKPDTACYNVLLGACARAGDFTRARDVLNKLMDSDDLEPTHVSWREMLRAASRSKTASSHLVEQVWNEASSYRGSNGDRAGGGSGSSAGDSSNEDYVPWTPDVDAFEALVDSYIREASSPLEANKNGVRQSRRWALYEKVLEMYEDVVEKREEPRGMAYVDKLELQESPRVMLNVLKAAVSLEGMAYTAMQAEREEKRKMGSSSFDKNERETEKKAMVDDVLNGRLKRAQSVAREIAQLECFRDGGRLPLSIANDSEAMKALGLAKSWI